MSGRRAAGARAHRLQRRRRALQRPPRSLGRHRIHREVQEDARRGQRASHARRASSPRAHAGRARPRGSGTRAAPARPRHRPGRTARGARRGRAHGLNRSEGASARAARLGAGTRARAAGAAGGPHRRRLSLSLVCRSVRRPVRRSDRAFRPARLHARCRHPDGAVPRVWRAKATGRLRADVGACSWRRPASLSAAAAACGGDPPGEPRWVELTRGFRPRPLEELVARLEAEVQPPREGRVVRRPATDGGEGEELSLELALARESWKPGTAPYQWRAPLPAGGAMRVCDRSSLVLERGDKAWKKAIRKWLTGDRLADRFACSRARSSSSTSVPTRRRPSACARVSTTAARCAADGVRRSAGSPATGSSSSPDTGDDRVRGPGRKPALLDGRAGAGRARRRRHDPERRRSA